MDSEREGREAEKANLRDEIKNCEALLRHHRAKWEKERLELNKEITKCWVRLISIDTVPLPGFEEKEEVKDRGAK